MGGPFPRIEGNGGTPMVVGEPAALIDSHV
jgi:hypothetical protein